MAKFDLVEVGEAKLHAHRMLLWPRRWRAYDNTHLPQPAWVIKRLATAERSTIPEVPGVYTLVVRPGIADHPASSYIMYVGKAESLRDRFIDYLTHERSLDRGRPKVAVLLNMYPDHLWFCYTPVPLAKLKLVEDELLSAYTPPCVSDYPAEVRRVMKAFQ